ncbi:MAG: hypothetical protein CMP10_03855 [Zetaproteobacteria bacterium]|nr:hypothetical protein [Pseudobdellovibrionaceae bacterium]
MFTQNHAIALQTAAIRVDNYNEEILESQTLSDLGFQSWLMQIVKFLLTIVVVGEGIVYASGVELLGRKVGSYLIVENGFIESRSGLDSDDKNRVLAQKYVGRYRTRGAGSGIRQFMSSPIEVAGRYRTRMSGSGIRKSIFKPMDVLETKRNKGKLGTILYSKKRLVSVARLGEKFIELRDFQLPNQVKPFLLTVENIRVSPRTHRIKSMRTV